MQWPHLRTSCHYSISQELRQHGCSGSGLESLSRACWPSSHTLTTLLRLTEGEEQKKMNTAQASTHTLLSSTCHNTHIARSTALPCVLCARTALALYHSSHAQHLCITTALTTALSRENFANMAPPTAGFRNLAPPSRQLHSWHYNPTCFKHLASVSLNDH